MGNLTRRAAIAGLAALLPSGRAFGGATVFAQTAGGFTLTDPGRPGSIATDAFPHSCCMGTGTNAGSVLVSCGQGVTALKVDPATGSFARAIIGGYPAHNTLGICSAFNRAWLADLPANQVAIVDFSTVPPAVSAMGVGFSPRDVVSDGTKLWVTESAQPAISAYDPVTHARLARVTFPSGALPYRMRYDGARYLYATDGALNKLYEIDTMAGTLTGAWPTGSQPWGVAIGDASLYTANNGGASVTLINRTSRIVTGTWALTAGDSPHDTQIIADSRGNEILLVDCAGADLIRALDAINGNLLANMVTGVDPAVIAVDPAGYLYNTNAMSNSLTGTRLENIVL